MTVHVDERFLRGCARRKDKPRVIGVVLNLHAADASTRWPCDRVDSILQRLSKRRARVRSGRDTDRPVDPIDRHVDDIVISRYRESSGDVDTGLASGRDGTLGRQPGSGRGYDFGRKLIGETQYVGCPTII